MNLLTETMEAEIVAAARKGLSCDRIAAVICGGAFSGKTVERVVTQARKRGVHIPHSKRQAEPMARSPRQVRRQSLKVGMSRKTMNSLRAVASARGTDAVTVAADILEILARENLYRAILGDEGWL